MTISGNNASSVFKVGSNVNASISGLTITGGNNTYGGGVYIQGTATLTDCTVSGNSATGGGGGVLNDGGTVTLADCTISGNSATTHRGGGVDNLGTATFTDCTISGNSTGDGGAGGLYNNFGRATLTDCTISGNSTTGQGGGVCAFQNSTLLFTGCTISGNYAKSDGGGLYAAGGTATLTNCTISGNYARYGGGSDSVNAMESLTLCTISNNYATVSGGGLYDGDSSAVTLIDTIVAGNNEGLPDPPSDIAGPSAVEGSSLNNLIGTGGSGGLVNGSNGNIVLTNLATLGLARLGDYGGPTATMALLPGSAAIGKGIGVLDLSTDQRGFSRGSAVDIGAFQTQASTALVVTATGDNGAPAGQLDLRGAVDLANIQAVAEPITFDPTAFATPQTITLKGPPLLLYSTSGTETITGPAAGVTISGGGMTCVFAVVSGATASLSGLTITGANLMGGGLYGGSGNGVYNLGTATLTDCTISGNAAHNGGGLFNEGRATLIDCTISGNSATDEGGGLFDEGTATLIDCTISGNSATNDGGGLYLLASGSVKLNNTIVAQNTNPSGSSDIAGNGAPETSSSNNLFGTGGSGGLVNGSNGNIVLTSLATLGLAPLGDYGGPTETMALLPGSAAIGKGITVNGVTTDGRGFARGSSVDIGAFQTQAGLVVNTTVDGTGSPAGDLSLRQAVNLANVLTGGTAITFNSTVFASRQTITLTQGQLELSNTGVTETITGPAAGVTISGGGTSGVFRLDNSVTATLSGLTITGGSLSSGSPETFGAGLYNRGILTLTDCTISGNSSTGQGGGLANVGAATLTDCTISGNSSIEGRGGGVANFQTLTLTDCTISGNSTGASGGGIYNDGGTATLNNCTISGNSATNDGGGLIDFDSTATLTNCTISGNSATGGGGLYNNSGPATLNNTIVAGNTSMGTENDISGTITAGSNNLIGTGGSGGLVDGTNGNQVGVAEPGLDPLGLQNNGGPTQTIALVTGSPAINTGNNALAVDPTTGEPLAFDERGSGFPRIIDSTVDIGAFEYSGFSLVVSSQPPTSVTAGSGFGLVVVVQNASGALDTSFNGTVEVALEQNGGSGTSLGAAAAVAGMVTFNHLTVTQAASGYTLLVSSSALGVATSSSFNVTPAATSRLVVASEPPTIVTAGSTFGLTVTAEDQYGNQTPAFTGRVAIGLNNNPGSGSLGGTLSENSNSGVAAFSNLTLDTAGNGYTIEATGTGLTAAITVSINVTPAAASQLHVSTQPPSSVTAGSAFGLTITALDPFGNIATGFNGSVHAALKNNPGTGSLGGTVVVTSTAGVAFFSNLLLDTAGNGYTIQATGTGLTDAISNSLNVTPLAATQLFVSAQPPSTVTAGSAFGLTVTALDQFGNIATGFTGSVHAALKNNPGTGSLGGTVVVTSTAGVAVFSNLLLDTAGNGYTIQATGTGLTDAITNSLNVTPAAATQLLVSAQPPSTVTAGSAFGLTVTALDQFGNIATGFTGSVHAALKNNPGTGTLGGTVVVNSTAGVAVFSKLLLDKAGAGFTIQATGTGVTDSITNSFNVAPAAASQLVVTTQPPAGVSVGNTFGLVVSALDPYGNVDTNFGGSVAVSLSNNSGGGTLGGTRSVTAQNGVAAISDLTLNAPGTGYFLEGSSTGLTNAISDTFEAFAGPVIYTVSALTDTGAGSGTTGDLLYCIEQANAAANSDGSLIQFPRASSARRKRSH